MGSCWCREKSTQDVVLEQRMSESDSTMEEGPPPEDPGDRSPPTRLTVENDILQVMDLMGSASANLNEQSTALRRIHMAADSADSWKLVISALVSVVPLSHLLGPSAITVIFEDIPLPSMSTVIETVKSFGLSCDRAMACNDNDDNRRIERNMLIVLGCIAEKFTGPVTSAILDDNLIEYLNTFLTDQRASDLVLYALVAVENFGKVKASKTALHNFFTRQEELHPLIPLERHHDSTDLMWRQVGFCARWLLDNMFFVSNRSLSYTTIDMSGINAMLNYQETTDLLKVSPDGLEARCDAHTFESVRCTFEINEGRWYYEVEIYTPGVMQIGWATKDSKFSTHEGYGIGDDSFSLAYDGCRRLLWHKANATSIDTVQPWRPGDILGCLIDMDYEEAIFFLNGVRLTTCRDIFRTASLKKMFPSCSEGFYAAASLMCFQGVHFNFGMQSFRFAPTDREFRTFNEHGNLSDEERQVVPRWLYLQKILVQDEIVDLEALCVVCYENKPNIIFSPCRHRGICGQCAFRLIECPICRLRVWYYTVVPL